MRQPTGVPIELIPEDVDTFKDQLVISRKGIREIIYNNEIIEIQPWILITKKNIINTSNIFGHIRNSSAKIRNWKNENIKRIIVYASEEIYNKSKISK
jgi:hypothetical protein